MSAFEPMVDQAAVAASRQALARAGRVHIPGVLSEASAQDLLSDMQTATWRLVLNGDSSVYDLATDQLAALDVGGKTKLIELVHAAARDKFQYLFDSFRISDACDAGQPCPAGFAALYAGLNSAPWLSFLRTLTGDERIAYVDAQATRYRAGHFLTHHTDDVDGKNRLFAYVLNLTPVWRIEWGGLLLFHSPDGHVDEAFAPRFNALNIFSVPQGHSVSVVAPFAGADRLSVTGWLRTSR